MTAPPIPSIPVRRRPRAPAARLAVAVSTALLLAFAADARLAGQAYGGTVRGGIAGIYGAPVGEFADFVERGYGLGVHAVLPLDRAGVLGLRADGGFLIYGHERQRDCLSRTVGCRILVDVNTTNSIALAGVGPELSLPAGPFRPYVNARAGLAYIATTSSIEGTRSDRNFADTTNWDDLVFSWGAGGGIAIRLGSGRTPVGLDLGVTWLDNGEASYLREGDIIDEPDGDVRFTPVRSDTDLVVFRLGIAFGG